MDPGSAAHHAARRALRWLGERVLSAANKTAILRLARFPSGSSRPPVTPCADFRDLTIDENDIEISFVRPPVRRDRTSTSSRPPPNCVSHPPDHAARPTPKRGSTGSPASAYQRRRDRDSCRSVFAQGAQPRRRHRPSAELLRAAAVRPTPRRHQTHAGLKDAPARRQKPPQRHQAKARLEWIRRLSAFPKTAADGQACHTLKKNSGRARPEFGF